MSDARKCDACGAYGEPPYAGWLNVEIPYSPGTRVGGLYDMFRVMEMGSGPRRFDVCSHACLPELAFQMADTFEDAKQQAERAAAEEET